MINNFKIFSLLSLIFITHSAIGTEKQSPIDLLFKKNKNYHTQAFIISHHNQIVFEKYSNPEKQEQKFLVWSITKSLLNLMVGKAIEEGYLTLESPVLNFIKPTSWDSISEEQKKHYQNLKVKHLLEMTSGLAFRENYTNPISSHVIPMLYDNDARKDMAQYALNIGFRVAPGLEFNYSSGDSNLLSAVLKNSMPVDKYNNYPWDKIFKPLGIDASLEKDPSGTFIGSTYLFIKAKDLIKIGQLIAQKGSWEGQQILPISWIEYINKVNPGWSEKSNEPAYSAHWWLNAIGNQKSFSTNLPHDLIYAQGVWGQLLLIVPSKQLVIVRLAQDHQSVELSSILEVAQSVIDQSSDKSITLKLKPFKHHNSNWVKFEWINNVLSIPQLSLNYYSKELCSCHFISKQSLNSCLNDLYKYISPSIDLVDQTSLTTRLLFWKSQAKFLSSQYGCQI